MRTAIGSARGTDGSAGHPRISYTREQLEPVAALPSFTRDDALVLGETVLAVVRPSLHPLVIYGGF